MRFAVFTFQRSLGGKLMRRRNCLALVLLLTPCVIATAEEAFHYQGQWRTTNRKLDGEMTCVVTSLGDEKWQGRFYGVWQGTPFDYVVKFSGPPSDLRGTATIDGASYTWTGQMTTDAQPSFKGKFGGSRYAGFFELRGAAEKQPATK
jgi:hypothetical protein